MKNKKVKYNKIITVIKNSDLSNSEKKELVSFIDYMVSELSIARVKELEKEIKIKELESRWYKCQT